MKKNSFSLLAGTTLILAIATGQAQQSGVYLTPTDFDRGILSYPCNCSANSRESTSDISISSNQIVVKRSDQTYHINKQNVYAVSYCGGRTVRIFKDGCYPILNPGEKILLYEVLAAPVNKGKPFTRKYYFSNGAGSAIQELTLENLRAEFSQDKHFEAALDKQVNSDSELYSYDDFHKAYRLNQIYDASEK
jgi:hypothetical protein